MRTYDSIEKVSKRILEDSFCEALLLKGSIGRGKDDEYSDVDMYAIVKEEHMEAFLENRLNYLNAYLPVVFYTYVDFVAKQITAVFNNGLRFDLYAVTLETLPQKDSIKILHDPNQILRNYMPIPQIVPSEELAEVFHRAIYSFVEADSAYQRKNYAWTSYLLNLIVADTSFVLRWLYDKEHTYLRLKDIHKVIPANEYKWLIAATENINAENYRFTILQVIDILDYCIDQLDSDITKDFQLDFYHWFKENIKTFLFTT